MLGAMLLTDRESAPVPVRKSVGPLIVVLLAGAAMLYAIPDMPAYGDGNSAANTGPGMEYMTSAVADVEIPNVVTAVLASYRGYDTMGETVVQDFGVHGCKVKTYRAKSRRKLGF